MENLFRVQQSPEGVAMGHPPTILRTLTREHTLNLVCWLATVGGLTLGEMDEGMKAIANEGGQHASRSAPQGQLARHGAVVSTAAPARAAEPRKPLWAPLSAQDIENDEYLRTFAEQLLKAPIGSNIVQENRGRTYRFAVVAQDNGSKLVQAFIHSASAPAAGPVGPSAQPAA